jgi:hypothetical protein
MEKDHMGEEMIELQVRMKDLQEAHRQHLQAWSPHGVVLQEMAQQNLQFMESLELPIHSRYHIDSAR